MRIVIFGATGSIGKHAVEEALTLNHQVVAFARNPATLNIEHSNLTLFPGDVFNLESVSAAIIGSDAVLISLGSRKLTGSVRSTGTRNIVKAMQDNAVKRLICQTTLGVGDSYINLNFFWKYIMFGLILRSVFSDHVRQEQIVKQSRLDWTIVRPAAFSDELSDRKLKHGSFLPDEELTLKIARPEVASFMLQQLNRDQYLLETPGLSY